MSDTTPQGTVADNTSPNGTTPDGNTNEATRIASLEKQISDRTSHFDKEKNNFIKELSAHEQLLKKEYSEDPSKIHLIEDESMRDKISKLVFTDLSNRATPYDDAKKQRKADLKV